MPTWTTCIDSWEPLTVVVITRSVFRLHISSVPVIRHLNPIVQYPARFVVLSPDWSVGGTSSRTNLCHIITPVSTWCIISLQQQEHSQFQLYHFFTPQQCSSWKRLSFSCCSSCHRCIMVGHWHRNRLDHSSFIDFSRFLGQSGGMWPVSDGFLRCQMLCKINRKQLRSFLAVTAGHLTALTVAVVTFKKMQKCHWSILTIGSRTMNRRYMCNSVSRDTLWHCCWPIQRQKWRVPCSNTLYNMWRWTITIRRWQQWY